jgi:hypothetical protein
LKEAKIVQHPPIAKVHDITTRKVAIKGRPPRIVPIPPCRADAFRYDIIAE